MANVISEMKKVRTKDQSLVEGVLGTILEHRDFPYSDLAAEVICTLLAEGKSLRWICSESGNLIPPEVGIPKSRSVVFRWLFCKDPDEKYKHFREMYNLARTSQGWTLGEEALDVVHNEKDPQRARILLDAIKWQAARMCKQYWGDESKISLAGHDGGELPKTIFYLPSNGRDIEPLPEPLKAPLVDEEG